MNTAKVTIKKTCMEFWENIYLKQALKLMMVSLLGCLDSFSHALLQVLKCFDACPCIEVGIEGNCLAEQNRMQIQNSKVQTHNAAMEKSLFFLKIHYVIYFLSI